MARHFRPFEFQAVNASFTALARARGLSCSTLRYRMVKKGMTLDEALALPPRSGKIAARARALGLNPSTVKARMRLRNMTAEQALNFRCALSPRGPETITQRARAAGMVPSTVHRRMIEQSMTIDEAIAFGRARIVTNGVEYRARKLGLNPNTIRTRMKRKGISFEEAVRIPLQPSPRLTSAQAQLTEGQNPDRRAYG